MKKSESVINFAAAAFSTGGVINSSVLQESMLKADLSYAFNQGTLTIDEKNGIWATSDAGVVAIRGGGIFTATEKETNGQWKWNTGILPTGINADLITTGQLDTNKINIYAGDKVRFQMNGKGLFAYKALFSEQVLMNENSPEYATYINSKNGDIDASQYITYNENGMYLVAKKGALVLNPNKNGYIEVGKKKNGNTIENIANFPDELHRVEISWDGLKLRDWNNQLVFFANPDNGNLTLCGDIETYGGIIGNWNISENSLWSKQISLISAGDNPGIYLTAQNQGLKQVEYNGVTYTSYNIVYDESVPQDQRDTTDYYINSIQPTITISNSNTTCLTYENGVISVVPKATLVENGALYIADPTAETRTALTYNGNKIEYNGSTSPASLWYQTTVSAVADMNNKSITDFVTQETGNTLVPAPPLPLGTQLKLTSFSSTFQVLAHTGEVTISNGKFGTIGSGGFTLKPNGLYDGTLGNVKINVNSDIMVGTSAHNIGNCFDRFEKYSDESGFTIYRVGGRDPVNFNIAGTTFFKNAISAALDFTWSVAYSDGYSSTSGGIETITAESKSDYGQGKICSHEVNTYSFWYTGYHSRDDYISKLESDLAAAQAAAQAANDVTLDRNMGSDGFAYNSSYTSFNSDNKQLTIHLTAYLTNGNSPNGQLGVDASKAYERGQSDANGSYTELGTRELGYMDHGNFESVGNHHWYYK